MLTKEDNEVLCRVGPGTLMGNLLRCYWMPALLSAELRAVDGPPLRVRLLGEDLVAYRATNGEVGLLAANCPHRGASLFFGRNEEQGLRCVYHGWKFDETGSCVDMPSEPAESNFKSKVRATAYPTHESGGIIWAYMGSRDGKPDIPDFGQESLPESEWSAQKMLTYCNWLQGLEGNLDTVHSAFLHGGRPLLAPPRPVAADASLYDRPGYPPTGGVRTPRDTNPSLEVQDTWYGFRYVGLNRTPNGYVHARVTDFVMPFYTFIGSHNGPLGGSSCMMYVPLDDNTTWRMSFVTKSRGDPARKAVDALNAQPSPYADGRVGSDEYVNGVRRRQRLPQNDYIIDREVQRMRLFTGIDSDNADQDMAITESMGPLYDRTREHLGTTDRAILRMRRMLINSAKGISSRRRTTRN